MIDNRFPFTEIIKIDDIIIFQHFKSEIEFLRHLTHVLAYDFAKKKIKKGSKILDVGTGEGYGSAYLALADKEFNVIGIDIDKNYILHARKKYTFNNLKFKLYNGNKLPFEDSKFDAVTAFQVIEHIKDEHNFISEIYRVLKPNGILIITTPNRIHRLRHGQKPFNIEHIREYYPKEIFRLLRSSFINIELLGVFGKDEIHRKIIELSKFTKLGIFDWVINVYHQKLAIFLPKFLISIFRNVKNRNHKVITSNTINSNQNFLNYQKYSLNNFLISKKNTFYSIDLLCVCKK